MFANAKYYYISPIGMWWLQKLEEQSREDKKSIVTLWVYSSKLLVEVNVGSSMTDLGDSDHTCFQYSHKVIVYQVIHNQGILFGKDKKNVWKNMLFSSC